MVLSLINLGLWNWLLGGLILLGLEVVIPGVFLVWFGCGAILTALICAALSPLLPVFDSWQMQVGLFSVLSIVCVLVGRFLMHRYKSKQTDTPFLNQRTQALIGEIVTLEEALVDGQGHIRLGDTLWRVHGPNLATGTIVRLVAFKNGAFLVEEADHHG